MFAGVLALAGAAAAANWWSRWKQHQKGEWVTKPLVTVLVVVAALVVDPVSDAQRAWFVAALVLCLAGDVFLMLPKQQFVAGLASFLLAHLAFIAGFIARGPNLVRGGRFLAITTIALLVAGVVPTVLAGVRRDHRPLALPVMVYILVIMTMVAMSGVRGGAWGLAGAISFALSDAMLAWDRFVAAAVWRPVAVMVTYHAALAGLVLSLS
jgi:uncharacterized membrane protein YhhN